ncbi:GTP-binding protein [endosymbiont GvMRE of Glomus versiforme]|uniref:GTP-binding protein n=1 Tax=endosymbiont GvMRE of Glomus versiforme TaxID=2039283 RepID=UPI000ED6E3C0|nr:GTP-binding protein [endosymbiont GvMRE of Glomus versiforme]RHZ35631.1 Translation initiation factor IF-2 [endosymbiont GvMRE of Glomus versiforme]
MKKNTNHLLLEIFRRIISSTQNELKNSVLYLSSESITISDLGDIINKPIGEIVFFFWNKEQVLNSNDPLSFGLVKDYCKSIGIEVKRKKEKDFRELVQEYLEKTTKSVELVNRPPFISVMGHVDHGKTTLLDTICHTNIQKKEAGGITQKVAVLYIEFQKKKLIFLDTPGHADFIRMRQQGIFLTDLVVLVIDAKDGVMQQTKEIIDYLHKYELPTIIFVNHKKLIETNNEENLNRIRKQLQQKNLIPFEFVSGNAKEKSDVDYLLEKILPLADFKTNSNYPTHGTTINSYLHQKGNFWINELLIQGGKLQKGDTIFINWKFFKVKFIHNIFNDEITIAHPGDLAKVVGSNFATELGDKFLVVNDIEIKKAIEKELISHQKKEFDLNSFLTIRNKKKNANLILMANNQNSLKALEELVKKQSSSEFNFSVVHKTVKNSLKDSIIYFAKDGNGIVLAFDLHLDKHLIKTLEKNNILFFSSDVIYKIEKILEEIASSHQETEEVEENTGKAHIKSVFYFSKGSIAGCKMIDGKTTCNDLVRVLRTPKRGKEIELFMGKVKSLEIEKRRVSEVASGQECGITLKGFDDFQIGDKMWFFRRIKKIVKKNDVDKK